MKRYSLILFILSFTTTLQATQLNPNSRNQQQTNAHYVSNPLVLIAGASTYEKNTPNLPGVLKDIEQYQNLFSNFYKYQVQCTYDKNNSSTTSLTLKRLNQFIRDGYIELCINEKKNRNKKDKKDEYDGLIFIWTGHGGDGTCITSDNQAKKIADIQTKFSGKEVDFFVSKPKIIIKTACTGVTFSIPIPETKSTKAALPNQHENYANQYAEFTFIFGATKHHSVSDRPESGSSLTEKLCSLLKDPIWRKKELGQITTELSNRVKESSERMECVEVKTTKTKSLYFFIEGDKVKEDTEELYQKLLQQHKRLEQEKKKLQDELQKEKREKDNQFQAISNQAKRKKDSLISEISALKIHNNTNEKSEIYEHGEQENWQTLIKDVKYKDLQKPLIQLYRDCIAQPTAHIKQTLPVYFVVGPKGAGKSTFIFAMQGNQITKRKVKKGRFYSSDERSDESDSDDNYYSELILKKTINLPTPEVATSMCSLTEGSKIYYTDKKIQQPMAFCDTEGFLGRRKDKISKAEKLVSAFAPQFALKANRIGGIVFLVSSYDIMLGRITNFVSSMSFLKNYFDAAIVGKNRQDLKKSIMLIITKETKSKKPLLLGLAYLIRYSYEDYYRLLKNSNQKSNQTTFPLAQLKPFFSLFLKKDVDQHELNKVKFFKLLDPKNICFFYPYEARNVRQTRQKLLQLSPLNPKYLKGNPIIAQSVIQKIIDRAYTINMISHKVLQHKRLTQLQRLMLQKDSYDALQTLSTKLKQRKKQLKLQNETIHPQIRNLSKSEACEIKDNKSKIDSIDELLEKQQTFNMIHIDNLIKKHDIDRSIASRVIEELKYFQEEMNMINCWNNRISRKHNADQERINKYIANYHEAVMPIDQKLSMHKTNNKFRDNEQECKEDDENNNNASSNLKTSVPLTITAILARLLKTKN